MPNPDLVAQIATDSGIYDRWTEVAVTRTYGSPTSEFAFSCAEPEGHALTWKDYKLKPGDKAQIILAGIKVIDGHIIVRNAGYDANSHKVIVQGLSRTCDIVHSSAEPAEYKGYSLEQITRGLLKPHGLGLVTKGLPPEAQKKIREFRVQHGETAWEAIERLGRSRGVIFTDDRDGNLVMSQVQQDSAPVAMLEEGKNIFAASAMLRDDTVYSRLEVRGQDRGTDQKSGADVSQVSAFATNPNSRPGRVLIAFMEEPGDTKDAQARADREMAESIATTVEVQVVVVGWKRPDGQLWDVAENCTIKSPMLFPTKDGKMDLAIRSVTFTQTPGGQTLTALSMCLPNALSILPGTDATRGAAPNILSGSRQQAQPESGSA